MSTDDTTPTAPNDFPRERHTSRGAEAESVITDVATARAPPHTPTTHTSPQTSTTHDPLKSKQAKQAKQSKQAKMRCAHAACRKRLKLMDRFACRCAHTYCSDHRLASQHACTFDFRKEYVPPEGIRAPKLERL